MKFLLAFLMLTAFNKSWSQSYMITNGTVNTCIGTFYDTGGPGGNYGSSQNFTYTLCSDNAQPIYVNFTSFNTEASFDVLSIYDGPTTAYPLIGQYSGTTSPGLVTTSGGTCLTFQFTSDAATVNPGWAATIGCGAAPPLQTTVTLSGGSGNWTVPCGVTSIDVQCYGAGGGGGADATVGGATGGGGGGGGYSETVIAVTPSQIINYAVGAAGLGGAPGNGSPGGNTTFASLNAGGGQGGASGSSGGVGGAGGTGSGGTTNMNGAPGFNGTTPSSGAGGNGAGITEFGAGGASVSVDANGIIGTNPGGGGGGAFNTGGGGNNGGNGGNGKINITYNNAAPHILGQLLNPQNLCQNQTPTSLGISAGGFSPTFQWYSNNIPSNSGGTLIAGATSANYSPNTSTPGTLYYYCIISGPCGAPVTSLVSGPIVVLPSPSANSGANQTVCQGTIVGLTITPSGGTPGYTYEWYNVPTGGTILSTSQSYSPTPSAGVYTYYGVAIDANSCPSLRDPVQLTVNPIPSANSGADQIICEGAAMSSFTVTPSGGTPGYSYEWYDAPTGGMLLSTNQIYSVGPLSGVYNYYGVVIDANSCVSPRDPVQLTVYPNPTMMSVSSIDITCFGNLDGQLIGNASGGTSPYQYSFDGAPPFNSNPITGLAAGTYSLYARDANGCTSSNWMSSSINEPPSLNLTPSSTNINCFGNANGSATITATGGVGGYSYSWSPIGGTASTASALPAGSYTCNVMDANSCPASYTFAITQPAALTVSPVGQTNVTCSSGSNGSATVSAAGGTGGYSYSWAPFGGTAATASGLMAGNYTCTVTDANGCTASQVFTINQPLNVTISSNSQTNILCNGAATGVVSVNPATGGSGVGYQYSLNGGAYAGATSFTGLSAGTYTVVARDNNFCPSNSVIFTLTQPSAITLGTSGNSAPCSGTALSVTLTGSGGAGGYTYSWIANADNPNTTGENFSTPSNTNLINNIIIDTTTAAEIVNYSVNVTDANACVANFNVPTTIAPAPTLASISNQVLCASASSAAIIFSSSIGGSTISWTNSSPSIGIAGSGTTNIASTTMVNVGVTPVVANFSASANFSGCTGPAQTFNITVNPSPVVTSANSATVCEGIALNLPLTANVGGTTFSWVAANNPNTSGESTGPVGTSTINNTITSTSTVNELVVYSVTPTSSGCVGAVQTVNVTVKPQPNLTPIANQTLCPGDLSSAISFTSDVGGSTFSWTNSNTSIGIAASGTANIAATAVTNAGGSAISGNFSAQATANGCVSTPQVFSITVNPTPSISVSPSSNPICSGSSTSLTASGANTYVWSPGASLSATTGTAVTANPASATTYTIVGTSVSGCQGNNTISIAVTPTSVGGTITGGTSPACSGSNSGTLTLSGNVGNVNGWEFSTNSGSSWTPIVNTTTTQAYSNLVTTTWYRAIVQSGVCASANSSIQIITVNNAPSTANAGIDQSLCNQTTATLSANVPGVGSGSWSVISGTASVTTPTSATSGVTGLTIGASTVLRWTIANSPCASSTDDITILSNPNPSISGTLSACVGSTSSLSGTGSPHGTTPWLSSAPAIATVNSSGLVTGISNGTVNITYMDINGCTSVASFTVNAVPATPALSSNSPVCEGGTLNLSTPAIGTYSWTGPNAFTSTLQNPSIVGVTVAATGTYSLTISSGGCTSAIATTAVTINPVPTAPTVSSNSPVCVGATINLTASFIAGATYSWTGPSAFSSALQNPTRPGASGLMAGNYSVTATVGGCTSSVSTTNVVVNSIPATPTLSSNSPVCVGGTLNLSTPAIGTYSWTGPNAFVSALQNPSVVGVTVAATGTYSLTVTSGGCTSAIATTAVTINPVPTAPVASNNSPICVGSTINLTASFIAGATYSWTGPSAFSSTLQNPTRPGASGLMAGNYSVTATVGGCTSSVSTTNVVVNSTPATPTLSSNSPVCAGGTLNLSTPAIGTYSWAGPNAFVSALQNPNISSITVASSGTYSLIVTSGGCNSAVATTNVIINNPPTASITAGGPLTFCSGNTVTFTASPNTGVNYQWKHGAANVGTNSSTYTTGNAGNHTVIVTDIVTGCVDTSNMLNVNVDALPTGTVSAIDASCNGFADGSVTVTPSGTGPFMYSYNGSAFVGTATQTGLSAGNYTVNVQSGVGCISSDILYSIIEPTAITGTLVSSTNPTCTGLNDGSATVSATGGNGVYNYSLNLSAYLPSNNFTGLMSGSYNVDIQDGNGCLSSAPVSFNLFDPTPLSVGTVTTDVSCFGGNNGTITANGSGGTGGYTYSIDNITFLGSNLFSSLSAGSYTVYISDAMGCTSGSTTSISQPASNFLISTIGTDYICDGEALAETFNSSGGFGSITYSWAAQPNSNGATSGSGNTISETLSTITTDPNVPETVIYDLYATDQNGCSASSTFTAYVHPLPQVTVSSDINPLCVSSVANLTATSVSDFFGWNPTTDLTIVNGTSATFTPSATGNFVVTYTVAMNTGANCTNSGAITLTVTPAPSAPTLVVNSPVCAGSSVNLTSNTIVGATYLWSGPNGFTSTLEDPTIPVALPADAGTYTCTVDITGCTSSSTVNVVVNPKPQAIILGVSTTFCANETFTLDGSNSLHNSSAITNYQWQLNGVDIPSANGVTYTGNTPGNYKLVVTNDLGCMDTTITPNIANADPIPTPVINGAAAFCTGNSVTLDGLASSAGGASVIDNYEWLLNGTSIISGPTNDSYVVTLGGNYQLIVLNSNGCKDTTAFYTVTENPIPSLPSVTPDPINVCVGSSTNVSVNSAIVGSTYAWASINAEASVSLATGTSNTVNGLTAGIASITVTETNSAGCTGPTYSVTVNINSAPTATASFTSNDTICYNGNASVTLNTITGGTYSWNSNIGLSSASQSVTFTNITNSGNVQFYGTVIDALGCASSVDTINLFVQNQLTVPTISNASSVCPGQAFTLDVSPVIPGADYYWTDPSAATQNGINLTSITIPVATAVTAGPYVVSYIDPQGCTSASSALYNQPLDPTPIINISGVSTICSGNSTVLSASTSIGTASAYQWFNNGVAIGGATSATYNVSTPGVYNVEIILSTGCMDSATIGTTVNVSSGPTVIANPTSSSVCAGNSATINASGAVTYSWDNGATTPSITVNPTTTTSYIVTGTDASGCTNSDTAVVIVNALPAAPSISAGSTTECAGTNVSLSSSSTLTNTWINTSTLAVIGTTQNITHTETVAGVYNYGVYVTDANSCNSATATIGVTFNSCLTNLISDNASTNSNVPVSGNFLTNDGSPSIFTTVSIINGPANGAITVSSNGNFTYTPNTNFSGYNMVVVQVCDVTPTCLNDTIYIVVNPNIVGDTYTVNGLSTPNTIIGNVLVNDAGLGISGNVTLVNSVTNGIIVIDSLGNFTYTPNAGFCGTDLFTYNTCDQNGLCANAGVNLIVTCDSTVTTTTGFSPNGDGVNDNWVIQGIETTENTVTVFDRWGNQVISFTNYNNTNTAWDGKNSNGVELPAGTYFYSIDIPNEKSKKGWVEITK